MAVAPIQLDLLARLTGDYAAIGAKPPRSAFNPARRGYVVTYQVGDAPDCPGCGRSHWLVGRHLAECAFCSTALPIVDQATAS